LVNVFLYGFSMYVILLNQIYDISYTLNFLSLFLTELVSCKYTLEVIITIRREVGLTSAVAIEPMTLGPSFLSIIHTKRRTDFTVHTMSILYSLDRILLVDVLNFKEAIYKSRVSNFPKYLDKQF